MELVIYLCFFLFLKLVYLIITNQELQKIHGDIDIYSDIKVRSLETCGHVNGIHTNKGTVTVFL